MEYRSLGRTGVQVSALCLGCMNFGWKTAESDAISMIEHALEQGLNFLDTANVYSRGGSETIVGKALKRSGRRDQIVLATKVHGRMDNDDILAAGSSRRHIIAQCEASLKRLQTDYIDLYQIHRPQSDMPIDETLRALDDLIRAGKVRYIGTSSFPSWRVMESLWVAKELGLNRFISEQPPYHLLDRSIERELIPMAQSYGLAILPWSPLARGFLTGKYKRGEPVPGDTRLAGDMDGPFKERTAGHFSDRAYDLLAVVEALAAEKSCSTSQLALAWVMQQPGVTSTIIGPRNKEQFDDNLGAAEIDISDDDRQRLDAVADPEQAIVPYYHGRMIDFKPTKHGWL
ncbi:MAG: aldo/keto reductase [Candidatus Promineifilaceae bacterium]|nr:aldo/keto reductase [Candidatus Promineifilaceae bacterium]